jgi:hypothetical protein
LKSVVEFPFYLGRLTEISRVERRRGAMVTVGFPFLIVAFLARLLREAGPAAFRFG